MLKIASLLNPRSSSATGHAGFSMDLARASAVRASGQSVRQLKT
jgi:hypothetical protein